MILVYANFKGGCAKTTSTVWSASILASLGYPVVVVDADRQNTLGQWHRNAAALGNPLPFDLLPYDGSGGAAVANAAQRAEERAGEDGYVIVDMSPGEPRNLFAVAKVARVVIVPVRPQSADYVQAIRTRAALAEETTTPAYLLVVAARDTVGTRDITNDAWALTLPEEEREAARYGLRPVIPLREGETNEAFFYRPPSPSGDLWSAYTKALYDLDALLRPVPAGVPA